MPAVGACPRPVAVLNSESMSETDDGALPPSFVAQTVSHVLVGVAVVVVTKTLFRQKPLVALVVGLFAFAVHRNFDAPLARRPSALGL
jgi:hypothetical protein